MESVTWQQFIGAAALILVLIGAYNTIITAVKNKREMARSSPLHDAVERIDKHDQMLAADKRRIENLEETTASLREHNSHMDEGIMVLMRSTLAMSRHMQHGNNIDGLRASEGEITDYLTKK